MTKAKNYKLIKNFLQTSYPLWYSNDDISNFLNIRKDNISRYLSLLKNKGLEQKMTWKIRNNRKKRSQCKYHRLNPKI